MRVSPAARGMLAASLVLGLLAGCSKPPSATSPSPGANVTVPVNPSNTTLPSDLSGSHVSPAPEEAAPVSAAAPVTDAVPAVGLAAGAPPPLIPFTSEFNGQDKLFVYDPTINDNYALPGAGDNIENPQSFSGNRILFEQQQHFQDFQGIWGKRQIYFYDVVAELLGTFNDVNGLGDVHNPSVSYDGTVMTFIHDGQAYIWINGVVAQLAKINSLLALQNACVETMRISCDGKWIVFTLSDGTLWVYDVVNPMVFQITAAVDAGTGYAEDADISPDGTQIVWADTGDQVFRYDRVTNLVDPMPFLNTAFNAQGTLDDPLFECYDNAHIYVQLDTRVGDYPKSRDWDIWREGLKVTRVISYNWITETVLTLTVLNSVGGIGENNISSDAPHS